MNEKKKTGLLRMPGKTAATATPFYNYSVSLPCPLFLTFRSSPLALKCFLPSSWLTSPPTCFTMLDALQVIPLWTAPKIEFTVGGYKIGAIATQCSIMQHKIHMIQMQNLVLWLSFLQSRILNSQKGSQLHLYWHRPSDGVSVAGQPSKPNP